MLIKCLATSLSLAHVIRQVAGILLQFHFVASLSSQLFYVDMVYFALFDVFAIICLFLWCSVVRNSKEM